jgi:hypothetical protein
LVYFDLVPAACNYERRGSNGLATRVSAPVAAVCAIKVMTKGRLKGSPTAAKFLRDAIDAALKMEGLPEEIQTAAARLQSASRRCPVAAPARLNRRVNQP